MVFGGGGFFESIGPTASRSSKRRWSSVDRRALDMVGERISKRDRRHLSGHRCRRPPDNPQGAVRAGEASSRSRAKSTSSASSPLSPADEGQLHLHRQWQGQERGDNDCRSRRRSSTAARSRSSTRRRSAAASDPTFGQTVPPEWRAYAAAFEPMERDTMTTELIFTALPNGRTATTLRLSVHISPRLVPDRPVRPRLADFPS